MNKIAQLNRELNITNQNANIDTRQVLESLSETRRQIQKLQKKLDWATDCMTRKIDHHFAYDDDRIENTKRKAQHRIDNLPSITQIQELRIKVVAAVEGKAQSKAMMGLVGIMLDGFKAKVNDSSDAFFAALLFMIEEAGDGYSGYSPEVIVCAIRLAWMASPFQPSISEFLGYLDKARRQYGYAAHQLHKLSELRQDAELVLRLATPDDWDDIAW
jgi:hypothetical protein